MRKIAVFTGTRAEYGLLYWIIKELFESDNVELQLYVGGMHLSPDFGYTVNDIIKDGFKITERLEMLLSSDTAVGISKSMGLATISAAEAFSRHKPDLLVVLGDRFESFSIAQAAMIACIPIAHIHGGESTEGLIDEAIRHSLTKMSHLHFVATDVYQKRVIQLGEQPSKVFNFGAPGIDSLMKLTLSPEESLNELVDLTISSDSYFLVTYHPVTLAEDGAVNALENLLKALESFPDKKLIITYPNADTHGRALIDVLDAYQKKYSERVLLTRSLGQLRYLSLMRFASAVIGNSSSGLIETPTFNVPTINIGNRQKGRISGDTVIDCDESINSIKSAIEKSLSEKFVKKCQSATNPYGDGTASERISNVLIKHKLDGLVNKSFYDIKDN